MPYSKQHKSQSRERILASAIALFSRHGYDNVTLDAVMAHAGMTRGAFYNHFDSKQKLYAEGMKSAVSKNPISHDAPEGIDASEHLQRFLNGYLSQAHLHESDTPCPMAFMVTDVANHEPEVRETYTHIFKGFSERLATLMEGDDADRPQRGQALAALLIGGVAVCRAFNEPKLVEEVLAACQAMAVTVIKAE